MAEHWFWKKSWRASVGGMYLRSALNFYWWFEFRLRYRATKMYLEIWKTSKIIETMASGFLDASNYMYHRKIFETSRLHGFSVQFTLRYHMRKSRTEGTMDRRKIITVGIGTVRINGIWRMNWALFSVGLHYKDVDDTWEIHEKKTNWSFDSICSAIMKWWRDECLQSETGRWMGERNWLLRLNYKRPRTSWLKKKFKKATQIYRQTTPRILEEGGKIAF